MKPFSDDGGTALPPGPAQPTEELRIAVTFKRPQDGLGPTKLNARVSARSVMSVAPDPIDMDRALYELHRRGFETTIRGKLTASIRGTRRQFEQIFGTKLEKVAAPKAQLAQFQSFYYPPRDAEWNPDPSVTALIDDAYIQWPHIYMARKRKAAKRAAPRRRAPQRRAAAARGDAQPSPVPPQLNFFHLGIPDDVVRHLNIGPLHQAGLTGRGVRIVMVDSGFDHSHPWFTTNRHTSTVSLAPGATHRDTDPNGHGTGESANIFSIAPGATFIGVKVDNDEDPRRGASLLEGFQEALRHRPQVISISMGFDLRADDRRNQLPRLPNGLVALEAEVEAAVAAGITVVFASGNGHYAFPGMMKEVISAGGVFIDRTGRMKASDYASAFKSAIFSGRTVPDFCGLVGMRPNATYITLPVPPGSDIDREESAHDGTAADDGWGVFSGTSAAAPQIAAVCALLLERNPRLTPGDMKAVLKRTARDVSAGRASPSSDPAGQGLPARPGNDGATGAGLIDAAAALQQV